MKKDKVIEMADACCRSYVEGQGADGPVGSYRKGFAEGADWRVRSVWHDVEMQPEDGRLTLIESGEGFPFIGGPQYWEWEDTVKQLDIKRWAYVGDLLPEEV